MVALQELRLQPRAPLWIPVHRHHLGEVRNAAPHAPAVPVNKADAGTGTITWIEEVPNVGIAVGEWVRRLETRGRVQTFSRVEHTRIDRSCARPETVAERHCEAFVAFTIVRCNLRQRRRVEERAHLPTEARVAPPERVEARPRVDDSLARRDARWKRPLGENHVRVR